MSVHERKASIKDFYGPWKFNNFILCIFSVIFLFILYFLGIKVNTHQPELVQITSGSQECLTCILELIWSLNFSWAVHFVVLKHITFLNIVYEFSWTGVIFPTLLQLQKGITDVEERKQKEICATKYKRKNEVDKGKLSEIDLEREQECSICMEIRTKVVLPNCGHCMCMKCYRSW